jgi:TonB family protein
VLLYIVYFFSEGSQMVKSLSYFAYVKEAFRFIGPLEPASPEGAKLLKLEKNSPGKAVEEVLRRFAREAERPLDALSPPGQAPGPQKAGEGTDPVEILTPTHGVDFTHYLNRSRSKVRRNWQAAIPESARLGAKGKVVVQFRILRDGTVSPVDVTLVISSGNDPMDRAAIQSILASSPLEPLPTAFPGAHVEVRFIFLYNLPLPSTTAQPPAP